MSIEKSAQPEAVSPSYTPVPYEFRELLSVKLGDRQHGRIFFFNERNVFDSIDGRIQKIEELPGLGLTITLDPPGAVRADRIITLFGKPGPAYDEYDRLGNVCFECTGGYDL